MTSEPGQRQRIWPWLAIAGLTAGCNGNGQTTDNPVRTGVFSDAPIAGLAYATNSQSGVTDADGRFRFRDGETVRFSIGGITLGSPAPATEFLTPLDIVPGAVAFSTVPEVRDAFARGDRAFFTLTNILVFLQTFDDDGDPARITLADGIAELFADAQFDFSVTPDAFQDNAALHYFAWHAARAGLIPTASPRKPGAALDHFYREQSLSHQFRVPQRIDRDIGNDGVTDTLVEFLLETGGTASLHTIQRRTSGKLQDSAFDQWIRNANGDVTWRTSDIVDDALPGEIWSRTFDALGMVTEINESTGPGSQSTTLVSRTPDGDETRRFDENADGYIDRVTERSFDAGGRLTRETEDLNMDGTPDQTRTLTYDSAGVLAMERLESDRNADGELDLIVEILFDGNGRPSTANFDNDGDGTIDLVESWTYDAAGRLLQDTLTNPVSGSSLIRERIRYDDAGRMVYRQTTSEFIHTWTYDATGALIESTTECPACSPPGVTTSRYSYDAASRRTIRDVETLEAGSPAERSLTVFEYDETGALQSLLHDDAADGSYDFRFEYTNQPGDWSAVLDTNIDQPPSFTVPAYYED